MHKRPWRDRFDVSQRCHLMRFLPPKPFYLGNRCTLKQIFTLEQLRIFKTLSLDENNKIRCHSNQLFSSVSFLSCVLFRFGGSSESGIHGRAKIPNVNKYPSLYFCTRKLNGTIFRLLVEF